MIDDRLSDHRKVLCFLKQVEAIETPNLQQVPIILQRYFESLNTEYLRAIGRFASTIYEGDRVGEKTDSIDCGGAQVDDWLDSDFARHGSD